MRLSQIRSLQQHRSAIVNFSFFCYNDLLFDFPTWSALISDNEAIQDNTKVRTFLHACLQSEFFFDC